MICMIHIYEVVIRNRKCDYYCVGLQVKEYLDNLGVEYRSAKLLGRMAKF